MECKCDDNGYLAAHTLNAAGQQAESSMMPSTFARYIPYTLLERFAGWCKGAKVGPRSARVWDIHRAPQARDWPLTPIRKPL